MANALGYSNPQKAVRDHIDPEDRGMNEMDTPSGRQNLVIINESGLYALIFGSKLDSAKEFKHWVTSVILPTIRKTGGYVHDDDIFLNTYLPFADDNTRLMFRTTLQTVRTQNEVIKMQQKEIHHKEDIIIGLVDDISLAEKRQILNRVVRYKGANYRERWSLLYREFENKYHINLGHRFESYNVVSKPKCKKQS